MTVADKGINMLLAFVLVYVIAKSIVSISEKELWFNYKIAVNSKL